MTVKHRPAHGQNVAAVGHRLAPDGRNNGKFILLSFDHAKFHAAHNGNQHFSRNANFFFHCFFFH